MIQLTFEDLGKKASFSDLKPRIVERFFQFHSENPTVYELFKRFSIELYEKGQKRYGAKAIMERIRWHMEIDCSHDDFKCNNNYVSCYVRLLILDYPKFKDFFNTRSTNTGFN